MSTQIPTQKAGQHALPAPHHQLPQVANKAPLEIGGSHSDTMSGGKPLSLGEHLDGALNFIADSLFSSGNASSTPKSEQTDSSSSGTNPFAEALKREQAKNGEKDAEVKKAKHMMKHQEMQMTEVFDLERKKTEQMIKQIKQELELLIKEIKKMDGNVSQSIDTAVFMDDPNPGVGHINFFAKLRNFLILLRKRVSEGNTWMQTFNSKKGKSVYQQRSAKYGSQYQFGQEGQGLTRQNG